MGTKPKFSDETKAKIEAMHNMGLKSPAIAAELGLNTMSVTGIIGNIVARRRGVRFPISGKLEDACNAKIVLVGNFTQSRILDYVTCFGADRVRVQP